MADKRKLQGEIDRCLKKVSEGVDIFEDLWQKIYSTTNVNIKEKHEADLKKEIKKLQRLRDAIKTWLTAPEVKEKKNLLEYKKLIETQMERFKVVERETKTKAFSKEGLGLQVKLDPKEKEKEDIVNWLSQSIDSLNVQVDQCESQIELISCKKRKNDKDKQDQIDSYKASLDRYKHHIGRLELIMRLLDNDALAVEQILKIKDDVDCYVSSNHEGLLEENEFIYEELKLDEISASLGKTHMDSLTSGEDDLSMNLNLSDTTSLPSSTCPSPTPSNLSHHNICNLHKEESFKEKKKSHSEDFNIMNKLSTYCSNISGGGGGGGGGGGSGSGSNNVKPQHSTSSNNLTNKTLPFLARSQNELSQQTNQQPALLSMVTTGQNYAQVAGLRLNCSVNESKGRNQVNLTTITTTSSSSSSSSPRLKHQQQHQLKQQQQISQQKQHHNDNHKKVKNVAESIISSTKNLEGKIGRPARVANNSPQSLLQQQQQTITTTSAIFQGQGAISTSLPLPTTTITSTSSSPTTKMMMMMTATSLFKPANYSMNCIDEITNDSKRNTSITTSTTDTTTTTTLDTTNTALDTASIPSSHHDNSLYNDHYPILNINCSIINGSCNGNPVMNATLGSNAATTNTVATAAAATIDTTTASSTVNNIQYIVKDVVSTSASLSTSSSSTDKTTTTTTTDAEGNLHVGGRNDDDDGDDDDDDTGYDNDNDGNVSSKITTTTTTSNKSITMKINFQAKTSAAIANNSIFVIKNNSQHHQSLLPLPSSSSSLPSSSTTTTTANETYLPTTTTMTTTTTTSLFAHRLCNYEDNPMSLMNNVNHTLMITSIAPSTKTNTTTTTTVATAATAATTTTTAITTINTTTKTTTTTTLKIDPIFSLTPLGRGPQTLQLIFQKKMLASASTHIPIPMDSYHIRSTNLPMPYKIPSYYTSLPPTIYNSMDFYLKLNPETLFFVFYYMEGSKAQYMAAKALKQLSWRFHTRYLMWFQRKDEPTLITEDYEQGSYIYFDYEKWCQRNVDSFTFEYKYLEDKDLS